MKLHTYPTIKFIDQDDEAVRVQLYFRGKKDHNWYSLKLRIPKNKLKNYDGGTADENEPNDDDDA